jgi:hypothetical protein
MMKTNFETYCEIGFLMDTYTRVDREKVFSSRRAPRGRARSGSHTSSPADLACELCVHSPMCQRSVRLTGRPYRLHQLFEHDARALQ